eukprot:142621-Rhodomonas_salina.1
MYGSSLWQQSGDKRQQSGDEEQARNVRRWHTQRRASINGSSLAVKGGRPAENSIQLQEHLAVHLRLKRGKGIKGKEGSGFRESAQPIYSGDHRVLVSVGTWGSGRGLSNMSTIECKHV